MARSNNQRRRAAKAQGRTFIPAWTKSKTRQRANRQKISAESPGGAPRRKLAYNKMISKHGKVMDRKFRAGGYNASGRFGNARTTKTAVGKKNKERRPKSKSG